MTKDELIEMLEAQKQSCEKFYGKINMSPKCKGDYIGICIALTTLKADKQGLSMQPDSGEYGWKTETELDEILGELE